jgi:glutamine amidotransferase/cyclase
LTTPPLLARRAAAAAARLGRNAIARAGFEVVDVASPADLEVARILVFPGVGAFGSAVKFLDGHGYRAPLTAYLRSGRPFMGVCLGMQTLFESSEESPGAAGLGIIPGAVTLFPSSPTLSVPHIGWNGVSVHKPSPALAGVAPGAKVYFVHSYRAPVTDANAAWVLTTTDYGEHRFISAVQHGNIFATQFHPEKSGELGIGVFRAFLEHAAAVVAAAGVPPQLPPLAPPAAIPAAGVLDTSAHPRTRLARRIIA